MADSASSTKTCSRCHELKPVSEFNKDRNREDGRSRYCSHCHREKLRRYRERDRATHNANRALWREANIEKVREYARNWYASNRAPKKEPDVTLQVEWHGELVASKLCRVCMSEYPESREFFPTKSSRQKVGSICRECFRTRSAEYRNRTGIKERDAERRRARNAARIRKPRPDKPPKVHAVRPARKPRVLTDEERARKARRAKERRAERRLAGTLPRRKNSPEVQRRANQKRRSTVEGVLNGRISSSIYQSLKWSGEEKGGRPWEALVGYTVHQLRTHLERQFRDGMSWGNRSLWHIDHIIPLSSFRFSSVDDPEFKAAWAMTNLRPLWAADNIRKHGKRQTLL